MGRIKQWLLDTFVYAGIAEEEYTQVRDEIDNSNRNMLKTVSFIAGVIWFILFLISFGSSTISNNHTLYGVTMVILLVLWMISRFLLAKHPCFVLPFCYLFLILFYGFGIILGTVNQPGVPATTFVVLLFVGPLLFIDKPYRMSVLLAVVSCIFCFVSFRVKELRYANLDETNVLSFLLVSIMVNVKMTQVKMRDIVHHRYIERERDTDGLTKLLTKVAMEREIKEYMKTNREPAALLVIDIDNFKMINDTYGHAYGDAVLRIMGQCICQVFRKSDLKGRFGGDEFVIFLPRMSERDIVTRRVEELANLMKDQIVIPENVRYVHGSIGIAFYPSHAENYEELFEKADEALYSSKKKGKDCYTFYLEGEMHH